MTGSSNHCWNNWIGKVYFIGKDQRVLIPDDANSEKVNHVIYDEKITQSSHNTYLLHNVYLDMQALEGLELLRS